MSTRIHSLALAVATLIAGQGAAAAGTATIVQNIPYGLPDESLDFEMGFGLSTVVPDDISFAEIGTFGLGVPCFDDPTQVACLATRIEPFDESLGTLTSVEMTFTVDYTETYGEVFLNGILNPGIPHDAGALITHSGFKWLIDTGIDADLFDVAGNPTYTVGINCMGVPGDEDDCGAGVGNLLNAGFAFSLNQRWDDNDPEWFGPNGIEEHFISSISDDIYLTIEAESTISDISLTNIADGEINIEGTYFYSENVSLVVTYEYIPDVADADGDGVPDSLDNCITRANVAQIDTNGDGFGNACDPDLNNDGIVNVVDLGLLRSAFFSNGVTDSDFNTDGTTNIVDLGILRSYFFQAPGPSALALGQVFRSARADQRSVVAKR